MTFTRRVFQIGLSGAAALGAGGTGPRVRRIRLAVAQMTCADGDIAGNLARATALAETAHGRGAELILFPELMPAGYALNDTIFAAAEPRDGPTARWLAATSRRLRCAIGTSFLEAASGAHYNTFVLTGRNGRELGRVRKETPASLEALFFRGEPSPHMIDTPFAKIGVGICYESYLCSTERYFAAGQPDLILLPHSFPDMRDSGGLASPPGTHVAAWHARRFGVPVAMCNKTGAWSSMTPVGHAAGRFPGQSAIVGSGGETLALLNDQPGVAVAEVLLDPARKAEPAPACAGDLIPALTQFDWVRAG